MIYLASTLAVGLATAPTVVIYLLLNHMRFLSDQNQTLTAALMATKNSPYASNAAAIAEPVQSVDVGDAVPLREDAPPGTRLLGS